MKFKFYLLALSATMVMATSCSKDETVEINNGDAISFNVVSSNMTRATATTTNTIDNFKVYAFTQNTLYMNGVKVTKGSSGWTYENTQFWPSTAVDFFAVSPSTVTVTPGASTIAIGSYTVKETADEDLLYSTNIGETKADPTVSINFRHALSQIVFQVKNTNTKGIKVEIKDVKIDGIQNTGALAWATKATTPNYSTETTGDTELTDGTWGIWTPDENATKVGYTVATYTTAYEVTGSPVVVKSSNAATTDAGALFLMPQTLDPWNKLGSTSSNNGSRLLVNCKITDVTSKIQLWPETGDYAQVAIPLTNPTSDTYATEDDNHQRWMQGKKYTYTIAFGEGGGYNPDPDQPDTPDPVLVPISFDVTVDEFQNGGSYDIDASN